MPHPHRKFASVEGPSRVGAFIVHCDFETSRRFVSALVSTTALCPPAPGVVVGDPHPERHVGLLPAEVDQGGGHDVLDPRPRVAPRDAHLRRLQ